MRWYFTVGVGGLRAELSSTLLASYMCGPCLPLSTGEACVITVLWSHMGSSQLHGQMVSCSIQAGAGLLCPRAGPCIPLDLRLYCQILESPLLLLFSDCFGDTHP